MLLRRAPTETDRCNGPERVPATTSEGEENDRTPRPGGLVPPLGGHLLRGLGKRSHSLLDPLFHSLPQTSHQHPQSGRFPPSQSKTAVQQGVQNHEGKHQFAHPTVGAEGEGKGRGVPGNPGIPETFQYRSVVITRRYPCLGQGRRKVWPDKTNRPNHFSSVGPRPLGK